MITIKSTAKRINLHSRRTTRKDWQRVADEQKAQEIAKIAEARSLAVLEAEQAGSRRFYAAISRTLDIFEKRAEQASKFGITD